MKKTSYKYKDLASKHATAKSNDIAKLIAEKSSNSDSTTKVNFRLEGPRKSCSFKGNWKLWKAFISQIKAEGGSVCEVLEPFCLAYLTSAVYLSRTIKPLVIENLNIERVVRRVRRYREEVETLSLLERGVKCQWSGCRRTKIAAELLWKGPKPTKIKVCDVHYANKDWKKDPRYEVVRVADGLTPEYPQVSTTDIQG